MLGLEKLKVIKRHERGYSKQRSSEKSLLVSVLITPSLVPWVLKTCLGVQGNKVPSL